jgi:hypothetical protein
MPPKIIPRRITCNGCEELKSRYAGLVEHGSDCYSKYEYRCDHPKTDKWTNRIDESLQTPDWCPYLIGK